MKLPALDDQSFDLIEPPNDLSPSATVTMAQIHVKKGKYFEALGQHSKAEDQCNQALKLLARLPPGDSLSEIQLFAYKLLQIVQVKKGNVAKALEIEKQLEERCKLDNITFNWHLFRLANVFVDADNIDLAIQCWKRVLDQFQDLQKFAKSLPSSEYKRVCALVSNTMNELSILYYNHGHKQEAQAYQDIIAQNKWNVLGESKYFEMKRFAAIHVPDSPQSAFFVILLQLKSPVKLGMVIKTKMSPGDYTFDPVEIDNPYVVTLKSNSDYLSPCDYRVEISLYENNQANHPIFVHLGQFHAVNSPAQQSVES